ncbi:MAG: hypothetical protein ACRDDX_12925 [Cellulosilyticaceae bacterium]
MAANDAIKTSTELTTQVGQEQMPFPMEGEASRASNIVVFVMAVGIFAMLAVNIKFTRKK